MKTEVDMTSPRYRAGWSHGEMLHAPVPELLVHDDYRAGWDEGLRFRVGRVEARVNSEIARRASDRAAISK
jgi:hypothetical protein